MDSTDLIFDEELIRSKLFPFDSPSRTRIVDDFFTPSAVLFSIIPHKNKPYELILIKRTSRKDDRHSGEMSFPGGKSELQDNTLTDTAIRECEEEIGVPRENIRILGCLHDFPTMTRFIISPFIGLIDKDEKLVKDEREVQDIVKVPIDFFFQSKNFREQAWDFAGKKFPVYYFNYRDPEKKQKYTIWGATAHMIATFIHTVYNINISKLNIRRFSPEEIKPLKEYIEMRRKMTNR
jgi:8-oxo-dGTP pyrophosphatase MutT (NUDIX family)